MKLGCDMIKWPALALAGLMAGSGVALARDGATIAAKGSEGGVTACITCHGGHGEGMAAAGFPRLAGLSSAYIQAQLLGFRQGTRSNPMMTPIAKALSGDDAELVADYYSAQGTLAFPVAPVAAANAKKLALGRDLTEHGDWEGRHLPACVQCHGPGGRGAGAVFPPLAGQGAVYIRGQLLAWQQGKRKGDPQGLMKHVADQLSSDEIDAVAAWFAASPPSGAVRDELQNLVAGVSSSLAEVSTKAESGVFRPPSRDDYPQGEFGASVRRGEAIFGDTNRHPASADYVGNAQQCANCHLGKGRLPDAAPMWASWVAYPAYRGKNKKVNTFIERVQGCFTYSMNAQASKHGGPPAANSDAIVDLNSYFFWLSKGAPTGDGNMAGRGFLKLAETTQGFDPVRGAAVYQARCVLCHGDDGQGLQVGDEVIFPPLWGARSYNWGAGMHNINKAAGFIKANMPLGLPGSLDDQAAWDVAAYINSFDRPQDPRFDGDLSATRDQFHSGKYDYYGRRKDAEGRVLGSVSPLGDR